MKHLLCIAALVLCSSVHASAQKQTIADIARRVRADRQAPQKTATVNNATLNPQSPIAPVETAQPAAKAPAPATTPAVASPAVETAVVPAPAAPADTRDEAWWRQQFDRARTDVRRAETQINLAQLELNSASRDLMTRSYDPDGRGAAAIAAAADKLAAANKSATEARARVTQLEEDLRRADAPAGWAR
jgi:hypothetical protein